jgi:hypothetical protein
VLRGPAGSGVKERRSFAADILCWADLAELMSAFLLGISISLEAAKAKNKTVM